MGWRAVTIALSFMALWLTFNVERNKPWMGRLMVGQLTLVFLALFSALAWRRGADTLWWWVGMGVILVPMAFLVPFRTRLALTLGFMGVYTGGVLIASPPPMRWPNLLACVRLAPIYGMVAVSCGHFYLTFMRTNFFRRQQLGRQRDIVQRFNELLEEKLEERTKEAQRAPMGEPCGAGRGTYPAGPGTP